MEYCKEMTNIISLRRDNKIFFSFISPKITYIKKLKENEIYTHFIFVFTAHKRSHGIYSDGYKVEYIEYFFCG